MDGYQLLLASNVPGRPGVGLELFRADGTRLAEVFRDDATGGRTFRTFGPVILPLTVATWFLQQADHRLKR